jgi:hypothetical protein
MANFTLPLDIISLEITAQTIDNKGSITFLVVSTCSDTTCHNCGKKVFMVQTHQEPFNIHLYQTVKFTSKLSQSGMNVIIVVAPHLSNMTGAKEMPKLPKH